MKKIIMTIFALLPMTLAAQDNTWELPEEEQEEAQVVKVNPDQKYLKGAVTEVDGRVVFSKHIEVPGKDAAQIYSIVGKYLQKMTREKNQISSRLVVKDSARFVLGGAYEEWLVFKKTAIMLDQTRFYYVIEAQCQDGSADITMSRIHYLYEEVRDPQRYKAEEWITDKVSVNKKNTKLLPLSAKFRRKTIDRKDFIFNKIESLLK